MAEPWRWEPLDSLFECVPVKLDSPGPLLAPARAMTVRRDERRGLHLTFFLEDGAAGGAEPPSPGTVRRADDRAKFTSPHGLSGVIDGVIVRAKKRTTDAKQSVTSWTQDATCASIEVEMAGAGSPKHTIEWIDNFQADGFLWFGAVVEDTTDRSTITFGQGEGAITLSAAGDGISSRRRRPFGRRVGALPGRGGAFAPRRAGAGLHRLSRRARRDGQAEDPRLPFLRPRSPPRLSGKRGPRPCGRLPRS